jgi:hypothetical protein
MAEDIDEKEEILDVDASTDDDDKDDDKDTDDDVTVDVDDLDDDEDDDDSPDTVSAKDFSKLQSDYEKTKGEVEKLRNDKSNLNKALHEARQQKKSKDTDQEEVLTDEQLVKILEDNANDPKTMLNIVKYQAEIAAKAASDKTIDIVSVNEKVKEADEMLEGMYPALNDETSEIRKAVNDTKNYYNRNDNPLGDLLATGVQVLYALPDLVEQAEKRGRAEKVKDKADNNRKEKVKENKSARSRSTRLSEGAGLTASQAETAEQLNLSPAQMKAYKQMIGTKGTVQVKE